MIYRVRAVRPKTTDWQDVEAASPEEAASEFQEKFNPAQLSISLPRKNNGKEVLSLCCVEVEGSGEFISRYFNTGIWRSGGVKPPQRSLREVAKILGWEHDPNELVAEGWPLEEQY